MTAVIFMPCGGLDKAMVFTTQAGIQDGCAGCCCPGRKSYGVAAKACHRLYY